MLDIENIIGFYVFKTMRTKTDQLQTHSALCPSQLYVTISSCDFSCIKLFGMF